MKIHLVGAAHVDGQAAMVKLIVAFLNFVNMLKKCPCGKVIQHNNIMTAHNQ